MEDIDLARTVGQVMEQMASQVDALVDFDRLLSLVDQTVKQQRRLTDELFDSGELSDELIAISQINNWTIDPLHDDFWDHFSRLRDCVIYAEAVYDWWARYPFGSRPRRPLELQYQQIVEAGQMAARKVLLIALLEFMADEWADDCLELDDFGSESYKDEARKQVIERIRRLLSEPHDHPEWAERLATASIFTADSEKPRPHGNDEAADENLVAPRPLDYYRQFARGGSFPVDVTQDQAAAVLKSHDHGVGALAPDEAALVDQVMSSLKDQIWP